MSVILTFFKEQRNAKILFKGTPPKLVTRTASFQWAEVHERRPAFVSGSNKTVSKGLQGWEMTQLAKCSPGKHEDLSLSSITHVKSQI